MGKEKINERYRIWVKSYMMIKCANIRKVQIQIKVSCKLAFMT